MIEGPFKGYPYDLSDKELKKKLDYYSGTIQVESQRSLPNYTSLINLGLSELNSRSNKKVTRIYFLLSGLSILIACTALLISLTTSHSSRRWEKNQLEVLKEINTKMDNQRPESGLRSFRNKPRLRL